MIPAGVVHDIEELVFINNLGILSKVWKESGRVSGMIRANQKTFFNCQRQKQITDIY